MLAVNMLAQQAPLWAHTQMHTNIHTQTRLAAGVCCSHLLTGRDERAIGTVGFGVTLGRQQAACLQMAAASINIS